MASKKWLIIAGLSLLAVGCDRPKQSTAVNPGSAPAARTDAPVPITPTTQQSNSAVAAGHTEAAHSRPAEPAHSLIVMDDAIVSYDFPPAGLHIDRSRGKVTFYSRDPKSAIEPSYQGHGYFLEFPLSDDMAAPLGAYTHHFKSSSQERQETTDGIFLEGQHYVLQPFEGEVAFREHGTFMDVALDGLFLKYDGASPVGRMVRVRGIVQATLDPVK